MPDVIELRGLRCSGVVGVSLDERRQAQPLLIDLDIERPLERAGRDDDLAQTTNYAEVLALVARVVDEGSCLLLETLAYRIARQVLLVDKVISSVTVAVAKLRPPVPEDVATVGVRVTLDRP